MTVVAEVVTWGILRAIDYKPVRPTPAIGMVASIHKVYLFSERASGRLRASHGSPGKNGRGFPNLSTIS